MDFAQTTASVTALTTVIGSGFAFFNGCVAGMATGLEVGALGGPAGMIAGAGVGCVFGGGVAAWVAAPASADVGLGLSAVAYGANALYVAGKCWN
jgi:hypothetical protein